jgi:hypothetical protein
VSFETITARVKFAFQNIYEFCTLQNINQIFSIKHVLMFVIHVWDVINCINGCRIFKSWGSAKACRRLLSRSQVAFDIQSGRRPLFAPRYLRVFEL